MKIPYVNGVRYNGNEAREGLTYAISGTVELGDAVTISAAGTVSRPAADAAFAGFVASKEADGMCAVNSHRVVQVKCASALTPGFKSLVGDGSGGVKAGAGGLMCGVLNVYQVSSVYYASIYIH